MSKGSANLDVLLNITQTVHHVGIGVLTQRERTASVVGNLNDMITVSHVGHYLYVCGVTVVDSSVQHRQRTIGTRASGDVVSIDCESNINGIVA